MKRSGRPSPGPGISPAKKREDIASILYREIVLGEDYDVRDIERFIEDYGVFYLILVSLKGSDAGRA